jgi:O-acetyl-ADP-ribose deacetylase (regulator of RNase III)
VMTDAPKKLTPEEERTWRAPEGDFDPAFPAFQRLFATLDAAREERDEAQAELAETYALRDRMSELLRGTADALHGGPLVTPAIRLKLGKDNAEYLESAIAAALAERSEECARIVDGYAVAAGSVACEEAAAAIREGGAMADVKPLASMGEARRQIEQLRTRLAQAERERDSIITAQATRAARIRELEAALRKCRAAAEEDLPGIVMTVADAALAPADRRDGSGEGQREPVPEERVASGRQGQFATGESLLALPAAATASHPSLPPPNAEPAAEPLPCPWCGSKPVIGENHRGGHVYCDCGARGPWGGPVEEAIAAWNRIAELAGATEAWAAQREESRGRTSSGRNMGKSLVTYLLTTKEDAELIGQNVRRVLILPASAQRRRDEW